jgi:hypothetical protein
MTLGDCTQPPDPCGDGGPAELARFIPLGLDFDEHGRLFVQDRNRVRVIDLDGTVRHVAGSWQSPQFFCGAPECGTRGIAAELPMEPYDIAADGGDLVLTNTYAGLFYAWKRRTRSRANEMTFRAIRKAKAPD